MSRTLTDQQRTAAHTLGQDLCVDAGAGSGKTTVLVERVMHLLEHHVELRRIVAITFTRKAAGEMKERLREAIHKRSANDPKSMDKWRALELEVESARVTTIDGFCAALLHENALRIGLDPDFATLGDEEAPLLRRDIAETTLAGLLESGDAAAHRLAVEHGIDRVTAFLAGALNQPARLLEAARPYTGLDAAGLAALWQVQAADLQRVRNAELAASPEILRFMQILQSYAGQCSDARNKAEALRCEALRNLHLLAETGNAESQRAGLQGLAGLDLRGGAAKGWSSEGAVEVIKAVAKSARELAKEYAEPECAPEIESAAAQLTLDLIAVHSAAAEAYRAAKRARTALDFADLLTLTVNMLREQPDLRARVAGGIEHLLMDEFQDTNHPQLELARMLAGPGGAKLFVVGDAKQSVYRFRGAEVGVFAEARHAVHQTLPLNENFRTVKPVIAFINDFFEHSGLLARVEPTFHRLTASRDCAEGPVVEFLIPEDAADEDGESSDEDDEIAEPRESEAALIAGRIAEMCGPNGAEVFDRGSKSWRPARFDDIAILYRAGTHAGVYEEVLRKHAIPANVIAGSGFYARQEILDLHNLFSTALDPWNEPALAAFLRSPFAGVTDDTLVHLTRGAKLAEAFWSGRAVAENAILDRARDLIAFIQARREWPVAALLREVLDRTGFEAVMLAQHHGLQKAGNVRKLIDLARGFGGAGRQGLHAFTEYLSSLARNGLRAGDAELLSASGGAVTLMTVHNAKGLEFPIVIVADMGRKPGGGGRAPICLTEPGRGLAVATHDARGKSKWPALGEHLKRHDREDDRAEEARVLYVAMTRARDRLLLASGPKINKHSWMDALDTQFALAARAHGDVVNGAAWSGMMVRRASAAVVPAAARANAAPLELDALRRQAGSVATRAPQGYAMPIRALLDLMHPVAPLEPPRLTNRAGLDPRLLGTAAHRLLERWDFTCAAPVEAIARDAFSGVAEREHCARNLASMTDRMMQSPLWPRLAASKNLRRELPFLFELDGILLSGVIDAWLDGDTIIDYKLSAPQPWKRERYETQLRLYAAAIRAATGRAPGEAVLYYLGSGAIEPVDVRLEKMDETIARASAALRAGFARPAVSGDARSG